MLSEEEERELIETTLEYIQNTAGLVEYAGLSEYYGTENLIKELKSIVKEGKEIKEDLDIMELTKTNLETEICFIPLSKQKQKLKESFYIKLKDCTVSVGDGVENQLIPADMLIKISIIKNFYNISKEDPKTNILSIKSCFNESCGEKICGLFLVKETPQNEAEYFALYEQKNNVWQFKERLTFLDIAQEIVKLKEQGWIWEGEFQC